jgi:hypothetical protein
VCSQKNGAVSKVNKKFISHLTRAQRTPSAAATVQVSHALPAVRFSCLLRGQFPRWRRSRKRLSVCSVLRCPGLWLQCSGLEKTHCMRNFGTVAAADGVRCARVRWEINFLFTFETASFYSEHPAHQPKHVALKIFNTKILLWLTTSFETKCLFSQRCSQNIFLL